uniref:Uncharacterized protein n=1 Tax=Rhizophora mucronata TaxID=61149 RepID=A0A2P2N972_RHIMU
MLNLQILMQFLVVNLSISRMLPI